MPYHENYNEIQPSEVQISDVVRPAYAFAGLVLGNVAIAFGPLLVRLADTGPVATGFWRLILAVPFLSYLAYRGGFRLNAVPAKIYWLVLVAGLLFGIDIVTWHIGIFKTKLGNATLFANCASILLVLYGVYQARRLPTGIQSMSVLIAFAGGALLMGQSFELSRQNVIGDALSLSAGIFYTGYLVIMIRVRGTTESWGSLAMASVIAAIVCLVWALLTGEKIIAANWIPLIILALSSQVLGQGLLTYALPHLSPLIIGLALLLQPALSAAAGWIVFDELLSPMDLLGGAMVMAALILVRMSGR
jgi:drug/metabolite transporter (DMT)-like permease